MRLIFAAGLALGLASAGFAEEGGFKLTPTLHNDSTGSKLMIKGQAGDLPKDAQVHIELLVRGQSRHPIRAAFLKLNVAEDKSFTGEWTWPGKKLAPLVYEAIASLRMNKQPPPVRRALAKDYGWHGNHTEILTTVECMLGTPEDAKAFKQETVNRLTQAITDLEGFVEEASTLCAVPATSEGWGEKYQELLGRIGARYRLMRNFHKSVVVRQYEGLFLRLIGLYATLTDALEFHEMGASKGVETLRLIPDGTKILREEIKSQMKITPSKELDKKDEKDGAEEDGAEKEGAGK